MRSPLTCQSRYGVCRTCYGRNLATGQMVGIGEAVGIIAAQSIGEPGTQLTMRTFHTGGVAGLDITAGLPRVEELFEARMPKGKAEISHIDGVVEIIQGENGARRVKVTSREAFDVPLRITADHELLLSEGDNVEVNQVVARQELDGVVDEVRAPERGFLTRTAEGLHVHAEDVVEREYAIPHNAKLLVENGQQIRAGDAITDGPINPQEYLETRGREAVQRYLVKEVQRVYRSQGVTINDKHIEIIVRQMLRKVRIDQPGDSEQLPFELVDRFEFEDINNKVMSEGGEPSTAETVLLGVTKASLNTSCFLAAASFQETTRVLTEAAINGAKDRLIGLKENVIIGKLIPAGSGAPANVAARREAERRAAAEALAGGELPEGFGQEYNVFLAERPVSATEEADLRLPGSRGRSRSRMTLRRTRSWLTTMMTTRTRTTTSGPTRSSRTRRPDLGALRTPVDAPVADRGIGTPGGRVVDDVAIHCYTPRSWLKRRGWFVSRGGTSQAGNLVAAQMGSSPPARSRPSGRHAAHSAAAGAGEGTNRSPTINRSDQGTGVSVRADDQPARAQGSEAQALEDQGPGDAQELEQPAPAPGAHPGRPAEARRVPAGAHDDAEEAELGAAQDRARQADQPDGGHGLHPGHRPQPAGALRRARARRPREGPPVRQVPHHPGHA